jgi:hypothetical protein
VKKHLKLHLSYIDHITIQLELRYLIGETAFAAETGETCWVMGQGQFFVG